MTYTEFKIGDVVFFNWDTMFTKLIHIYNNLKYGENGWAHTGIITKIEHESIQIHEAVGKGFTSSWYTKEFISWADSNKILCIKRPIEKLESVEDCANRYLGRKYGFLDLIGIVISFLSGWKILNITGANKLICSEAVARILYDASKNIDFSKEFNKSYDLITPQDLYISKYLNYRRKL